MIAIVESGGANIASIQFALARLGVEAQLTRDADIIKRASQVILPGVGAAGVAMQYLRSYGLLNVIPHLTQPVLGICLGMQLLFASSEENQVDCLNIIPGKIKKIAYHDNLTIPHMGWNTCQIVNENKLLKGISSGDHVYFVHSYAAEVGDYTLATTKYGETFSSAVKHKNFHGVQFHPERSGSVGGLILKNFLEIAS